MWLFDQDGLAGALRISHVIVAVMWVGLLWFFNFVQVPAFAELDPGARNQALDKLTWRALWWFRWAAAATVAFGLLLIFVLPDTYMESDFWTSTYGLTLLARHHHGHRDGRQRVDGDLAESADRHRQCRATCWPAVKPTRTRRPRRVAARWLPVRTRSSRCRSSRSWWAPSHFYGSSHFEFDLSGGAWFIYFIIGVAIIAALELNALGKISGTGNTGLNVIYETHKNAMYAGFALIAFWYLFAELLLRD